MSAIYKVKAAHAVRHDDPLHWYNFYPDKQRHHQAAMQKRQDLILFLANLHRMVWDPSRPRSFSPIKFKLTDLRRFAYDFQPALDHFFEVVQHGYSLSDGSFELSTLIPKRLPTDVQRQLIALDLSFEPDPRPTDDDLVVSKVYLADPTPEHLELVKAKLVEASRHDLIPVVKWLFSQNGEFNFLFKPAGKLRQRDTSVWPVHAIETWPSWLREDLFGPGIDIDSAYTQFLMQHLREIYSGRETLMKTIFPDLLALIDNKQAWRHRICTEVLGLEWNDANLSTVKTICMSLANGSRISPAIMQGGRSFSVTAQIIIEAGKDTSEEKLAEIGATLQNISRQYSQAKKAVCSHRLHLQPSLKNQKQVFAKYFEWEREARYLIWEGIDRHGIMVHDGIDGVPKQYLQKLPQLITQIGVRLTS